MDMNLRPRGVYVSARVISVFTPMRINYTLERNISQAVDEHLILGNLLANYK